MVTGIAVFSACILAGGVAWAAIPGGNGTIDGCYLKLTGTLRVIDTAKGGKCIQGLETAISWNQKGDPGPAGLTGDPGPAGKDGAPGVAGHDGKDGAPGTAGTDGKDGAPGAQGDPGPQGAAGPQGPAGSAAPWALVQSDGFNSGSSTGVTTTRVKTGVYVVTFPAAVNGCGITLTASQYAGIGLSGVNPDFVTPPDVSHVFFSVYSDLLSANSLVVGEYDSPSSTLRDGPFTISLLCS